VLWSRDRDWTPPLSMWKVGGSFALPNGATLELLDRRHHREIGAGCRITPLVGTPVLLEEIEFVVGPGDDADPTGVSTDINRDGVRDLIVMAWSGGAHCCATYHLFELPADGSVRKLAVIEAQHGGEFGDVDGDGIAEFVMADWSLAYELGCFACIDLPGIVLKWSGSDFELAPELMLRPPPSIDQLRRIAESIDADRTRDAAPPGSTGTPPWTAGSERDRLVSAVLKLVYQGNAEAAWRLFDAAWPAEVEQDRGTQRAAIVAALAKSPHAAEIEAMQQRWADFEGDDTNRSAGAADAP